MRNRIFYSTCFGFILGVLWRSFIFTDLYWTILFSLIALALFLFFSLISKNKWGIISSIFVLAFCSGIFRFHLADVSAPDISKLRVSQSSQNVSLTGEIIDEPSIGENNQKLTVAVQGLALNNTKILVSTNLEQDFRYGDEINFSGKLQKPQ